MARVLVVEDDVDIRVALVRALTHRGHVVHAVGEAMTGIREVTAWEPDVVVLDLGLPDLDGALTLSMIRSVSRVPVVIATARDTERNHPAARRGRRRLSDQTVLHRPPRRPDLRRTAPRRPTAPPARTDRGGRPAAGPRRPGRHLGRCRTATVQKGVRPDRLPRRPTGPGDRPAGTAHRGLAHPLRRRRPDIDVHVSWLRRKLGESAAQPRYLHTVRGVGVKLVARPRRTAPHRARSRAESEPCSFFRGDDARLTAACRRNTALGAPAPTASSARSAEATTCAGPRIRVLTARTAG